MLDIPYIIDKIEGEGAVYAAAALIGGAIIDKHLPKECEAMVKALESGQDPEMVVKWLKKRLETIYAGANSADESTTTEQPKKQTSTS